jgi:hypothetical protein
MMLVYNLPQVGAIFDRFGGINGSAYFIGGFGMTALTANNIVVVPIRSGRLDIEGWTTNARCPPRRTTNTPKAKAA